MKLMQPSIPYLGSYTWANRPSATANANSKFFCSDIASGIVLFSDGEVWKNESGGWLCLASKGIPVFLPSSGVMGNNGALSGITALPLASGDACYMYFPANAISAGSAAGLYYTVMSSTTAGTVYNNTYTSGAPLPPASPTAFSTIGLGAYVQTTGSDITLLSHTLPGGLLGKNGELFFKVIQSCASNGNSKITKINLGASATFNSSSAGSFLTKSINYTIKNSNNQAIQFCQNANTDSQSSSVPLIRTAINTASDVVITITAQLAVATDYNGFINNSIFVSPRG